MKLSVSRKLRHSAYNVFIKIAFAKYSYNFMNYVIRAPVYTGGSLKIVIRRGGGEGGGEGVQRNLNENLLEIILIMKTFPSRSNYILSYYYFASFYSSD